MITPGRSRLFPTVSVSLERQLDLWTTDSTKITTFNTFPHDPSARRLLEMMHFDFETQYTLKIPKPQDLVKFNDYIILYIFILYYIVYYKGYLQNILYFMSYPIPSKYLCKACIVYMSHSICVHSMRALF